MKVGVLTGGGDAPALNSCLFAIAKYGRKKGLEIIGFLEGWKGVLDLNTTYLNPEDLEDYLVQGGTILKTSRVNPKDQLVTLEKNLRKEVDRLIVIGGNDTLSIAHSLSKNFPLVGIPKTIDNDLSGTEYCIGFNTAVLNATELIDKLKSTAKSHNRVFVVEVMGRSCGWIAIKSAIATGAHAVLIPEFKMSKDELIGVIRKRYQKGSNWAIVVVAEGTKFENYSFENREKDPFGNPVLGGVGDYISRLIKSYGFETRYINLGHLIRGGNPSAYDRIMAIKLGIRSIDYILLGKYGKMIGVKNSTLVPVSLRNALELKKVPLKLYRIINKLQ